MKIGFRRRRIQNEVVIVRALTGAVAVTAVYLASRAYPDLRRYMRMRSM